MGPRTWKAALFAAVVAAGTVTACAPPPEPLPPLIVNTTADTFDGACDEADCSLLDAIHAANGRVNTADLPNEIQLPEGTYVLTEDSPVQITRALLINGAGRLATVLDLSGSPVTAPAGVLDVQVPLVLNGVRVQSSAETPTHVLASCDPDVPTAFVMSDSLSVDLAATSAGCDAGLVNVEVQGPTTVLSANTLTGTGSRLPFSSEPLELRNFNFLASTITGPVDTDGTASGSQLRIVSPEGLDSNGAIVATHFDRVGLTIGTADSGDGTGNVAATVASSSFDLGAEEPSTVEVLTGSSLRVFQSTFYGGGAVGAFHVDGTLILEGATVANAGPALVVGDDASVSARRSILSTFSGPTCTAPVELLLRNFVVGTSCGAADGSNVSVASHDDLQLGPVSDEGSGTPTFSMMPSPTSPVVDVIPVESTDGTDCPFDVHNNFGLSLDQRGTLRPSGVACDAGAVEYPHPPPEDPSAQ